MRRTAYRGSETIHFENEGDGCLEIECKAVGSLVDDEASALQEEIDLLTDDVF